MSIDWRAPTTCPAASDVLQGTLSLRSGLVLQAHQSSTIVSVARIGVNLWQAQIYVRNAQGIASRTLRGETCQAVADATSVVLAFTLQEVPPEISPQILPQPLPREPSWLLGIRGIFDKGSLPASSAGASIAVGWRSHGALIDSDIGLFSSRSAHLEQKDWEGASFSLKRFAARGCLPVSLKTGELAPCVGTGFQHLSASGFGSQVPSDNSSTTAFALLGVSGLLDLNQNVGIRYGIETLFPLRRPSYVIEGTGSVYQQSVLALQVYLGPQLRF
jgi:hypothetical protein